MIEWREQKIELPLRPIETLYQSLSTGDAQRIESCGAAGLVILVDGAVRDRVEEQLAASDDEQGGLLIGAVFTNDAGGLAAVHVSASVPAMEFSSSGTSLRMGPQVWTDAREALQEDELIVGWYHSHPGLTAFFSDTDRKTQRAFFPHPFSVGWVRDPIAAHERWFAGAESVEVPAARVLTTASEMFGAPRPAA